MTIYGNIIYKRGNYKMSNKTKNQTEQIEAKENCIFFLIIINLLWVYLPH